MKKKTFNILLILFIISLLSITIFYNINDNTNDLDIAVLSLDNMNLKEDNKYLKELNDIKLDNYDYIKCKTILRNIYSFYNEIIINVGKDKNIEINDAVINEHGLVGIISDVYDTYSRVLLITNKDLNISVNINSNYGNLNNYKVTNMNNYANVYEGDIVYTSGITSIPGNIYVGRVINIEEKDIEKDITIENNIDIDHIDYLIVIKDTK